MNTDLPKSIQSVSFENPIWGLLFYEDEESLLVDIRDEQKKETQIWTTHLESLLKHQLDIDTNWLEKWIGTSGKFIYFIRYLDAADPSKYQLRQFNLEDQLWTDLATLPSMENVVIEPHLYDVDSDHHKTVAQFLSLELLVPCEYLELDNKIIISYYLRSQNGFDRFLLLIEEGEKRWKLKQDSNMKGFASGAFFVVQNKLVFVKDRNEVCIHSF